MPRLERHLRHIEDEVVPARRAARPGLAASYLAGLEARPQPPLLVRALDEWNEGRFYEQHETLEFLWRATDEPVRDAFKGIIQSGVGAYHALKQNRRGALAKWTGALAYLAPFDGWRPYGIDTASLRAQVAAARAALLADVEEANWDGHAARARALRIDWVRQPAEPTVTAALEEIDRRWHDPHVGLGAALEGLTSAMTGRTTSDAARSAAGCALRAARGKAAALRATFGVDTPPLAGETPWRLAERWVDGTHQALRAAVGAARDAGWETEHAEALSRLMRADEKAAAEIRTLLARAPE